MQPLSKNCASDTARNRSSSPLWVWAEVAHSLRLTSSVAQSGEACRSALRRSAHCTLSVRGLRSEERGGIFDRRAVRNMRRSSRIVAPGRESGRRTIMVMRDESRAIRCHSLRQRLERFGRRSIQARISYTASGLSWATRLATRAAQSKVVSTLRASSAPPRRSRGNAVAGMRLFKACDQTQNIGDQPIMVSRIITHVRAMVGGENKRRRAPASASAETKVTKTPRVCPNKSSVSGRTRVARSHLAPRADFQSEQARAQRVN